MLELRPDGEALQVFHGRHRMITRTTEVRPDGSAYELSITLRQKDYTRRPGNSH
jgi:hypothetical protein